MTFHPTAIEVAWVCITGSATIFGLMSITHLVWFVIPQLHRRKAWDFGTVRSVVYNYLRRDLLRTVRMAAYTAIGVSAMLVPAPRTHVVMAFEAFVSVVLFVNVANELLDAVADFRYRQHWLRPIPFPLPIRRQLEMTRKEKSNDPAD